MGIEEIVQLAKDICSVAACAALLIKPVREWMLGTKEIREGQRCLLRSEIVRIYYRHNDLLSPPAVRNITSVTSRAF